MNTPAALEYVSFTTYSGAITRLSQKRKKDIKCPYIQGDGQIGGFIWSHYSVKKMKAYIEDVYLKAMNVYKDFIETFFQNVKNQMGMYQLLPARMEGYFEFEPKSWHGPSIMWGIIPSCTDSKSSVCLEIGKTRTLMDFSKEMYDKVKALDFVDIEKPYISYSVYSQACHVNTQTPVTDLVYEWLKSDLKRIGLMPK